MGRCGRRIGNADCGDAIIWEDDSDITRVRRGTALGFAIRSDDVDRAVRSNPNVHSDIVVAGARKELVLVLRRRQEAGAPVDVRGSSTIHNLAGVTMRRPVAARVPPECESDEPGVRPSPIGSLEKRLVEHAVEPRILRRDVDLHLRHRVEIRARRREVVSASLDRGVAGRAGITITRTTGVLVVVLRGRRGSRSGRVGRRDVRRRSGWRRVRASRRTVIVIELVEEPEAHNEDEESSCRQACKPEEPCHVVLSVVGGGRGRAGALLLVLLPFDDDVVNFSRRVADSLLLKEGDKLLLEGVEVLMLVNVVVRSDALQSLVVVVRIEQVDVELDQLVEHGGFSVRLSRRARPPWRSVGPTLRTTTVSPTATRVRKIEARHGVRSFFLEAEFDAPIDVVEEMTSSNIRIHTDGACYAFELGASAPGLVHVSLQLLPVQVEPPLAFGSA